MVDYLEGRFTARLGENELALEVAGLGFHLFIIPQVWSLLPPIDSPNKVKIYVSFHPTEKEGFQIFGFDTRTTRDLFNQLKSISGCGPKTALNLLASIPLQELIEIIERGDVTPLLKIKGIGGKIASRLIIELKALLKGAMKKPEESGQAQNRGGFSEEPIYKEVKKVLTNLGYIEKEISWVFNILSDKVPKGPLNLDHLVALALDEFGKKREKSDTE